MQIEKIIEKTKQIGNLENMAKNYIKHLRLQSVEKSVEKLENTSKIFYFLNWYIGIFLGKLFTWVF